MRAAQLENNVVVNYVLVGGFDGVEFVDPLDSVIGSTWNGTSFTPPAPVPTPVPASVTMRQARLALLSAGKLASVGPAIDAMPSPQKEQAQIEWEFSSTVERHRPLVQAIGPMLGMTEEELDDLFILAATL